MLVLNEVKKSLYKEKPSAFLTETKENGDLKYTSTLLNGDIINFCIPKDETIDVDGKYLFSDTMDGKLLIRWINI